MSGDPLREDFRQFLAALWKFLGLPAPTPVQYDIAYHLQHGPTRDIIQAFRGAGKSWITAGYVLWLLYCNPQLLILVVSASGGRAAKFTRFCLDIIMRWELLAHLRPKPHQRQSTLGFDVGPADDNPDQNPSMEAKGITGQITGGRADVIIADDIEIPRNSDTEVKREKLREQIREFDAIIKPGGQVKYLGTPQSESSIYTTLRERGYSTTIWPILFPTPKQIDSIYGTLIAPSIVASSEAYEHLQGTSVEPNRFDEEDLAARKLSYGSLGFALQFLLDTSAGDANKFPLKLRDLIVMDCSDPEVGPERCVWASSKEYVISDLGHYGLEGDRLHSPAFLSKEYVRWQESCMYIDPSGKGKDETSYAIVKYLNGRLFVTAFGGIKGGYEEPVLEEIGRLSKLHKVQTIMVEDNFGQGMFAQLLKPHVTANLDTDRVTVQKERRIISSLEPVISSHRLVIDRSAMERDHQVFDASDGRAEAVGEERARYYSLTYQMSRVTFDRGCLAQDDRLDALAGAVRFFTERMDVETGLMEVVSAENRLQENLDEFIHGQLQHGRTFHTHKMADSPSFIKEGTRR